MLHGTVLRQGIVPAYLQNYPRPPPEESFSYWCVPWAQLWNSENLSLHCPLFISWEFLFELPGSQEMWCPQVPLVISHPLYSAQNLPGSTSGKESTCQCRSPMRCGFDPWVRHDWGTECNAKCILPKEVSSHWEGEVSINFTAFTNSEIELKLR